jgi:hypothetical protein
MGDYISGFRVTKLHFHNVLLALSSTVINKISKQLIFEITVFDTMSFTVTHHRNKPISDIDQTIN